MKKRLCYLLAACMILGFVSSGCTFRLTDPENLIIPPSSEREQLEQKKILTSLLEDDEHITIPLQMERPSTHVYADFDQDGQDEMLFFFTKSNGFEVGLVLAKKNANGDWVIITQEKIIGRSVDYFRLLDLDQDHQQEILFGIDSGSRKTLHILSLKEKKFQLLSQIEYDMLTFHRVAEDKPLHMIYVLKDLSSATPHSQINVAKWVDNGFVDVFQEVYTGFCKEIVWNRIDQETTGFYATLQHDFQFTSVMFFLAVDDVYHMAMDTIISNDYISMEDASIFADIDDDGAMELQTIQAPLTDHGRSHQDYLTIWKKWNKANDLEVIKAVLNNQTDGYIFNLPNTWAEHIEYTYNNIGNINYLTFYQKGDLTTEEAALFTISTVDKNTFERSQELRLEDYLLIGNNPITHKVYLLQVHHDTFGDQLFTAEELVKFIQIIGGGEHVK